MLEQFFFGFFVPFFFEALCGCGWCEKKGCTL